MPFVTGPSSKMYIVEEKPDGTVNMYRSGETLQSVIQNSLPLSKEETLANIANWKDQVITHKSSYYDCGYPATVTQQIVDGDGYLENVALSAFQSTANISTSDSSSQLTFGNFGHGSSVPVAEKVPKDVDQTISGQVDFGSLTVGTKNSTQDIAIIQNKSAGYVDPMVRLETGGHCEPANFLYGSPPCTDPETNATFIPPPEKKLEVVCGEVWKENSAKPSGRTSVGKKRKLLAWESAIASKRECKRLFDGDQDSESFDKWWEKFDKVRDMYEENKDFENYKVEKLRGLCTPLFVLVHFEPKNWGDKQKKKGLYRKDRRKEYGWPDTVPFCSFSKPSSDDDAPRARLEDLKKIAPYLWGRFIEQVIPKLSPEANFMARNDETKAKFPDAKSLSGVESHMETEYPVPETGSNSSETVTVLREILGENLFTTIGNDFHLNVDVREVQVETPDEVLNKESNFQLIKQDITFSNNQKSSAQVSDEPQASGRSSTASAFDEEVSQIMSSQPSSEIAISNATSWTSSPVDIPVELLNEEITEEMIAEIARKLSGT